MPITLPSTDLPASAPKVAALDVATGDPDGGRNAQSRIDHLLGWYLRKAETPGEQRSTELTAAEVKELIELLDKPNDEFMVAVLADGSGRSALAGAFKLLVPKIWDTAKRSRNPKNYSGAFPGPLMAMMRDRQYDGFLNRWRELCEKWGLDEGSLIRAHQHAPARARPDTSSPRKPRAARDTAPPNLADVVARWRLPPGVRPADVFAGPQARRKYETKVYLFIRHAADSTREYWAGSMSNARQGRTWEIFGGNATQTPSWWGQPSCLLVEGEEARAKILIAMGAELTRSRTYARYLREPSNRQGAK